MPDSIQQAHKMWTTRSGQEVVIRPICGDDEDKMSRFHGSLSAETVYTRYFNVLKLSERIAHDRLDQVCHPAPREETVLVVETAELFVPSREIIGVGRLSVLPGMHTAEMAFVVGDSHQRQGIGTELLRRLLLVAKATKVSRLRAHILPTNIAMQRICLNTGMQLIGGLTDGEVTAELDLSAPAQERRLKGSTTVALDSHRRRDPGSDALPLCPAASVTKV
jgi:acetyltransferase